MIASPCFTGEPVRPGDRVILIDGPYEGTPGVLLRFNTDPHWAEIREWNDRVRSHPVTWLRKSPDRLAT